MRRQAGKQDRALIEVKSYYQGTQVVAGRTTAEASMPKN